MARREVHLALAGRDAECSLEALYLADGDERRDLRTRVRHAEPGCRTHELYKGILDGRARGIFDGLIYVAQDAQKTDARQTNRNLLLSPAATAYSLPRLEIYADDVKCTHGSTTGQLSDEQHFYLRTRGFSAEAARALLTYAFASELLETIAPVALRQELTAALLERLPQGALIEVAP
jgi:Fe-S cluster assembly protein SufD